MVEYCIVAVKVAGSSPVIHPSRLCHKRVCVVQGEVLRIGNEIRCKRIPHNADYRFESCSLQLILETINHRVTYVCTIDSIRLVNSKTTKGSHHSRGRR